MDCQLEGEAGEDLPFAGPALHLGLDSETQTDMCLDLISPLVCTGFLGTARDAAGPSWAEPVWQPSTSLHLCASGIVQELRSWAKHAGHQCLLQLHPTPVHAAAACMAIPTLPIWQLKISHAAQGDIPEQPAGSSLPVSLAAPCIVPKACQGMAERQQGNLGGQAAANAPAAASFANAFDNDAEPQQEPSPSQHDDVSMGASADEAERPGERVDEDEEDQQAAEAGQSARHCSSSREDREEEEEDEGERVAICRQTHTGSSECTCMECHTCNSILT